MLLSRLTFATGILCKFNSLYRIGFITYRTKKSGKLRKKPVVETITTSINYRSRSRSVSKTLYSEDLHSNCQRISGRKPRWRTWVSGKLWATGVHDTRQVRVTYVYVHFLVRSRDTVRGVRPLRKVFRVNGVFDDSLYRVT